MEENTQALTPPETGVAIVHRKASDGDHTQLKTERAFFAEWLAFTTSERKLAGLPVNQKQFALIYHVSNTTLARWRKNPEFEKEVTQARATRTRMQIGDRLETVTRHLMKGVRKGDMSAVRMAFDATGVFPAKGPAIEVNNSLTLEQSLISNAESLDVPTWMKRAEEKSSNGK